VGDAREHQRRPLDDQRGPQQHEPAAQSSRRLLAQYSVGLDWRTIHGRKRLREWRLRGGALSRLQDLTVDQERPRQRSPDENWSQIQRDFGAQERRKAHISVAQ